MKKMKSLSDFRKHILEETLAHLSTIGDTKYQLTEWDIDNFRMICSLIIQSKEPPDECEVEL